MSDDPLLYDDYFSDPSDAGVEVHVLHRGKRLRFKVRRSLTLGERQRAADVAIKIELDNEGKPVLKAMDQAAFTRETLLVALKEWPFTYRDGRAVPINRQTVAALDSALSDRLAMIVLGQDGTQQEFADGPFAPASVED